MFFVKIEFNEVIEISAIFSTQIKFLREIENSYKEKILNHVKFLLPYGDCNFDP